MRRGLPQTLRLRLDELTGTDAAARWLVAFSGGLDSTVLLHALSMSGDANNLFAVHIDHGLHPDSSRWKRHCRTVAEKFAVNFESMSVQVDPASGFGIEAAARKARYDAFARYLQPGDCLLTAHHQDDQAETLMLNLLRGSGPGGVAGIGVRQSLGAGRLLRPLLRTSRQEIMDYAVAQRLQWIDDPSNEDRAFDRNYLRHEVMPLLAIRWPSAAAKLARSSSLMAEASDLLVDLAKTDLARCGRADRIALDGFRTLPAPRQANLFRHAIKALDLPPPPATRVEQLLTELVGARSDAQPLVAWQGAECRRYNDELFILPKAATLPAPMQPLKASGEAVVLGSHHGVLSLQPVSGAGIAARYAEGGLDVRYRRGGEALRISPGGATRTLKNLLQEQRVFPWMRERLPLLYSADRLVAVADLWVAAECLGEPGYSVRWIDKPALR